MPDMWSEFAQRAGTAARDPAVQQQLDGIARVAAALAGVPMAAIVLNDAARPIIAGQAGTPIWTDKRPDLKAGALWGGIWSATGRLVVPDARADARFAADPLVTGAPFVRFLLSLPLTGRDGQAIGALCVIDTAPRAGLSAELRDDLGTLAKAAMTHLAESATFDRWNETRQFEMPGFETLANALPQLVWSTRNDGSSDYFSRQWCEFTGAPASASYGTGWLNFVHPDDVPATREAWRVAVETGEPYAMDMRLRHADQSYRWMLTRGLPVTDETGRISRWIGTCTDIDERVRTSDMLEFMSRELSHRIKNMFSVVQVLIAMTLRNHPGMAAVSQSLQLRMVALGKAHDLVRPRFADGASMRSQTTLRELIRILTVPYNQDDPARVEITGDDTVVDEQAATPLALFFHEMAMNSTMFGALSVPDGTLRIAITVRDEVTIDWQEGGGPPIASPPVGAFGLSLTKLAIERQLGGILTMDWHPGGLQAVAQVPLRKLTTP